MIHTFHVILQFALCGLSVAVAVKGGEHGYPAWGAAVFLFGLGLYAIAMACKDHR